MKKLKNFRKAVLHSMGTVSSRQLVVVAVLAIAFGAHAAGDFGVAINKINSYKDEVALLMKAIAACIAIIGAFNVYFKMQNGDQDVKKTIMLTIGGCIAFVALSEMLPAFFT